MADRIYFGGSPWTADDDDEMLRIHRGDYQVMKVPKLSLRYQMYWPGRRTLQWILDALNEYEKTHPLKHSVND